MNQYKMSMVPGLGNLPLRLKKEKQKSHREAQLIKLGKEGLTKKEFQRNLVTGNAGKHGVVLSLKGIYS